jgi:hypothetical protein
MHSTGVLDPVPSSTATRYLLRRRNRLLRVVDRGASSYGALRAESISLHTISVKMSMLMSQLKSLHTTKAA